MSNSIINHIEQLKKCKLELVNNQFEPLINNIPLNDKFFNFLIENKMNRYMYGFMIRQKNLDINNISFFDNLINPHTLEKDCGESFVKKYECEKCGHLIYRKNINQIDYLEDIERECPNCGKINFLNYSKLKDDFQLNYNDILTFLDNLVNINIFSKKLVAICSHCTKTEIVTENTTIKCPNCNINREFKNSYVSNYDFLIDGGHWFEWYVYNICKLIYGDAFLNYQCQYEIEGKTVSCEFDVLVHDNNKVKIFECKDYMNYSKQLLKGDNFYNNITRSINIADDVYLISSVKKIKENSKDDIHRDFGEDVIFLEGMDLEDEFLNSDRIISYFKKTNIDIINLFNRLPENKQNEVFVNLLNLVIEENKPIYFKNLSDLLFRANIKKLLLPNYKHLIRIRDVSFSHIYQQNRRFTHQCLTFILSLFRVCPELVHDSFDLNKLLDVSLNFLHDNPYNYIDRAPFYYFISSYFAKYDINDDVNSEVVEDFMLKFIPMIDIYFGNYSYNNSLCVFEKLWFYKTDIIEEKLFEVILSRSILMNSYKKERTKNFIKNIGGNVSSNIKNKIEKMGL